MFTFDKVWEKVLPRYREPHRFYHNEVHIRRMIHFWDQTFDSTRRLEAHLLGGIAILYHDAVYDPIRQDNEERSADLMEEQLGDQLNGEQREWVRKAILATKHRPERSSFYWHDVICDIDLLVLAGSWPEYKRYLWQIRHEYSMFSDEEFWTGRSQFITDFGFERSPIFKTQLFADREETAKQNLRRELNDRVMEGLLQQDGMNV